MGKHAKPLAWGGGALGKWDCADSANSAQIFAKLGIRGQMRLGVLRKSGLFAHLHILGGAAFQA